MALPFCAICGALRDEEGHLSCEAFPLGIPKLLYPFGCGPHGLREGFKPTRGFEETARRWSEFDQTGVPEMIFASIGSDKAPYLACESTTHAKQRPVQLQINTVHNI
jgi:hypothetical protein